MSAYGPVPSSELSGDDDDEQQPRELASQNHQHSLTYGMLACLTGACCKHPFYRFVLVFFFVFCLLMFCELFCSPSYSWDVLRALLAFVPAITPPKEFTIQFITDAHAQAHYEVQDNTHLHMLNFQLQQQHHRLNFAHMMQERIEQAVKESAQNDPPVQNQAAVPTQPASPAPPASPASPADAAADAADAARAAAEQQRVEAEARRAALKESTRVLERVDENPWDLSKLDDQHIQLLREAHDPAWESSIESVSVLPSRAAPTPADVVCTLSVSRDYLASDVISLGLPWFPATSFHSISNVKFSFQQAILPTQPLHTLKHNQTHLHADLIQHVSSLASSSLSPVSDCCSRCLHSPHCVLFRYHVAFDMCVIYRERTSQERNNHEQARNLNQHSLFEEFDASDKQQVIQGYAPLAHTSSLPYRPYYLPAVAPLPLPHPRQDDSSYYHCDAPSSEWRPAHGTLGNCEDKGVPVGGYCHYQCEQNYVLTGTAPICAYKGYLINDAVFANKNSLKCVEITEDPFHVSLQYQTNYLPGHITLPSLLFPSLLPCAPFDLHSTCLSPTSLNASQPSIPSVSQLFHRYLTSLSIFSFNRSIEILPQSLPPPHTRTAWLQFNDVDNPEHSIWPPPILVLNLIHRTDRVATFLSFLHELNYPMDRVYHLPGVKHPVPYWSCLWSHYLANKFAVDMKFKWHMVVEDDVALVLEPHEFIQRFNQIGANIRDTMLNEHAGNYSSANIHYHGVKLAGSWMKWKAKKHDLVSPGLRRLNHSQANSAVIHNTTLTPDLLDAFRAALSHGRTHLNLDVLSNVWFVADIIIDLVMAPSYAHWYQVYPINWVGQTSGFSDIEGKPMKWGEKVEQDKIAKQRHFSPELLSTHRWLHALQFYNERAGPLVIAGIDYGLEWFEFFFKPLFNLLLANTSIEYEYRTITVDTHPSNYDFLLYTLVPGAQHPALVHHATLRVGICAEPDEIPPHIVAYSDVLYATARMSNEALNSSFPHKTEYTYWPYYTDMLKFFPTQFLTQPTPDQFDAIWERKTKFCAYLYSYDVPHRVEMFQSLSKYYKEVDALGQSQNKNSSKTNKDFDRHTNNWMITSIEKYQPYKFVIASENSLKSGYITEKFLLPMLAYTVPLYWGPPDVLEQSIHNFNTKRFIYVRNYSTLEECWEVVKRIDQDKQLFLSIISQPIFIDNQLSDLYKPSHYLPALQQGIINRFEEIEKRDEYL